MTRTDPATERQMNYLADLARGRMVEALGATADERVAKLNQLVGNLKANGVWTRAAASKWIDRLRTFPKAENVPAAAAPTAPAAKPARTNFSDIAQGYYATASKTGNNDLDFWFVKVPEDGKWKGYRFVKRVIGGHSPERVHKSTQLAALHAIVEAGPALAGKRFADELGRCSNCGRHLTDELSRERGMGPDCYGRLG